MDRQTADVILALNEEIDRLWRYLGHRDEAQRARHEASEWERRAEGLKKETEEFLLKTTAQTTQYLNVVAVVGYAGYFTTWNFTRDILQRGEASFVALMGLTSLAIYCAWEIFLIHARMKSLSEFGALLRDMVSPEDFELRRRDIVAREAKWTRMMTPVLRLTLFATIAMVGLGALTMGRRLYLSL